MPNTMHHGGQRQGVAPPSMPPAPVQHPQSPEMPSGGDEESPHYVNAKQFHRILKRRVARQILDIQLRLTSKGRKSYLHESRHNHAIRRPRGPGGRILTADQVAVMEKGSKGSDDSNTETSEVKASGKGASAGNKPKSESGPSTPNKKAEPESDSKGLGEPGTVEV